MILIDTSVWIDHLRRPEHVINTLRKQDMVLMHPFVLGELSMGNLSRRAPWLETFYDLPQAAITPLKQVLEFIDMHVLHGSGIGYIDAHLLASASRLPGTLLWTRDKRLQAIGLRLKLAAEIQAT
ncbi:type II toxin-antitoxin system VapC family toxin [Massilia sp. erpn]|uniref:type II toxin-antitoxin system VapC family toxin n=1 Tax=Massilia sp. erpn TaxID=2738142 RepID=UPI00210737C7|nr:type II toxin-antitoxin system VapC family toxin [Massilia sp. erpn]UTY59146.1 type II toxin-antitoxin system VapC family toxin [Massilia sp. erpn]